MMTRLTPKVQQWSNGSIPQGGHMPRVSNRMLRIRKRYKPKDFNDPKMIKKFFKDPDVIAEFESSTKKVLEDNPITTRCNTRVAKDYSQGLEYNYQRLITLAKPSHR